MEKQRSFVRYLLFGYLYVGIQEFWVSFVWRSDIVAFALAVLITETVFLTIAYYLGRIFDRTFARPGVADIAVYVVLGLLGLITIEWMFAGNIPGQTEANQFVMFTTWGGAALFGRIFTDNTRGLEKVKTYTLRFFLVFAGIATLLGLFFKFINPQLSFAITYIAAVLGYPLMNVFFIWFFVKKLKISKTRTPINLDRDTH